MPRSLTGARTHQLSLWEHDRAELVRLLGENREVLSQHARLLEELGERLGEPAGEPLSCERWHASSPAEVARRLAPRMRRLRREELWVVLLDHLRGVLGVDYAYKGGPGHVEIQSVGALFREAIVRGAAGILLAHNHCAGSARPSEDDLGLTERVSAAGELLDIPLLDHLIISDSEWVSLRGEGLLGSEDFAPPDDEGPLRLCEKAA
jgi:DNA repair protein RadC